MFRKRTLFLFTCILLVSTANFLSYASGDNWPNGGGDNSGDESGSEGSSSSGSGDGDGDKDSASS